MKTPSLKETDLPLLGFGPLETMVRSAVIGTYDFDATMQKIESARALTSEYEDEIRLDKFHALGALLQWTHNVERFIRIWRACTKTEICLIPDTKLPNKVLRAMNARISNDLLSLPPNHTDRKTILNGIFEALVEVIVEVRSPRTERSYEEEALLLSSSLMTTLSLMETSLDKLQKLKSLFALTPSPFAKPEYAEQVRQLQEDATRFLAQDVHNHPEPAKRLARLIELAPETGEARHHLFAAAQHLIRGSVP
jgi:hypothetical protein